MFRDVPFFRKACRMILLPQEKCCIQYYGASSNTANIFCIGLRLMMCTLTIVSGLHLCVLIPNPTITYLFSIVFLLHHYTIESPFKCFLLIDKHIRFQIGLLKYNCKAVSRSFKAYFTSICDSSNSPVLGDAIALE
jgi:hypothetical protein